MTSDSTENHVMYYLSIALFTEGNMLDWWRSGRRKKENDLKN